MTQDGDEIDEIEALLPWYAAGRLSPADVRRVETALATRAELRASLQAIREDRDETIALNESLSPPSGDPWARVMAAVQAEPRKPTLAARASALASWIGLGPQPNRTRLAFAGAAAALVIVLQAATIVSMLPSQGGGGFQTASGPDTTGAGAELLVAFAPDARLDQLAAFLQERHGVIVDGPRGGLYRVRFGDKPLSKDDTTALIKALSAAPIVRMALPAGGK